MLIDLLSPGNFVSYNVIVAKLIGLHEAIYVSELLRINEKATSKGKTTDGFFILDRDYMEHRTTFNVEEQKLIEKKLKNLGVLLSPETDNESAMKVDTELLTGMLMSEDEKLLDKIKVFAGKKPRMTKQEKILSNLQQNVTCSNDELKSAYYDWIESVITKSGWLSKAAVVLAQETVDDFAQHDLDVALDVVRIASVNGYRDINWAIQRYRESRQQAKPVKQARRKNLGDDVF